MNYDENYSKYDGAVVVLDALGTKGIWNNIDPQKILNNWKQFVTSLYVPKLIAKSYNLTLTYNHFSDTIIMIISEINPGINPFLFLF
jgi:hypothetical protein